MKKCEKARKKREQDQEIAGLDVGNIITTQGNSYFDDIVKVCRIMGVVVTITANENR